MTRLLPHRPALETEPADPLLVHIDESDGVVGALQSDVARRLLDALYEEPGVASGLADRVGTSLQNVQYHLGRLEEANLVRVAGTWYSEKGAEMDVYAPAGRPLLLVAGSEEGLGAVRDSVDASADPPA